MVKRGLFAFILTALFILPSITAATACNLGVNLINQDPYPANPGDYVDIVFQIDGVSNPACGLIYFEVKEDYPFSLDPDETNPISIRAGTFERGYGTFYIAPFKIRVDANALDGNNPMEISITTGEVEVLKEFNINIQDSRADFEIFVKDYDFATHIMTFEILNIEDNDIEALTIEIPKQDNIDVKGPNINIVGDLDSNEYTSAEFEATSSGGDIELKILYTDSINVRRELEKTVNFDPAYFKGRQSDKKSAGAGTWIIIIAIIVGIVWWWKKKKKKKHAQHAHRQHML